MNIFGLSFNFSTLYEMPARASLLLPQNFRSLWPDVNKILATDGINGMLSGHYFAELLQRIGLISKDMSILEIGAGPENALVEALLKEGFTRCMSIDADRKIIPGRNMKIMDFRDLLLNNKFDHINFSQVLEYFRDEIALSDTSADVRLFAQKIYAHLKPGGTLSFSENRFSFQRQKFIAVLEELGLIRRYIGTKDEAVNGFVYVFEKPLTIIRSNDDIDSAKFPHSEIIYIRHKPF